MRKRHSAHPISDDEQIARYAYLLGNVPASVADKAYAAAFTQLSTLEREELVGYLRAQLPVAPPEPPSGDPDAFVVLMRDLHSRSALVSAPGAASLAGAFITSPPIFAYFTAGAGSVMIDQQPLWVNELARHETAPLDGGQMQHRHGAISGEWYA